MILGLGTDILNIQRFSRVLIKHPKILYRLFTAEERFLGEELSNERQKAFYAKRFAAKEALFKSCGVGPGSLLSWHDFRVLREPSGKPIVLISQRVIDFCFKKFHVSAIGFHISISDEKKYIHAVSILESY